MADIRRMQRFASHLSQQVSGYDCPDDGDIIDSALQSRRVRDFLLQARIAAGERCSWQSYWNEENMRSTAI